jgi:putative ABC transport system permease protein
MKFARLIWKNALRNKRRSMLTIFSLAASLFLLTTLRTVLFELQAVSNAPQAALRLVTRHAVSFANPLPIAYMERIRQVPGVREVIPGNWFGGIYVDESNFFGQFTVDQNKVFDVFPEFQMPEDQKEAFRKLRNGAIAGTRLCERFGWKLGQRVTLMGTNYPVDLELVLVGRFTSLNPPDETSLMFRYDYFDEALGRVGQAGWFTLVAERPDDMPGIIRTVDDMFRSSGAPTKTESEKEFQLSFSGMMGNVKFLVASISAVVVFTILLVTAATMGMSIRERTNEFGIMKSLGFSRGLITALLTGESLLIALTAWVFGCVGAWVLYSHVDLQTATGGWFAALRVQPDSLLLGFGLSLVVALVASGLPAWRASGLNIADAIRHVG